MHDEYLEAPRMEEPRSAEKQKEEEEMSPPRATMSGSAPKGNANFCPETNLGSSTRGLLKRKRRKTPHPHSVPYENETSYQV
jgi:hypothetical protein